MSEHQTTTHLAPERIGNQALSHSASEREKAILSRVREKAVLAYRAKQQELRHEAKEETKSSIPWWRTLSLAGAGVGFCLALFLWIGTSQNPVPLDLEPSLRLSYSKNSAQEQAFQLRVASEKSGTFRAAKHWEIKAFGGTSLAVKRRAKQMDLELAQGRLQIHVHPNTMKRFVIRFHQGYKLWVRGTRFTVEQSAAWLYVEVQRGKVEIQRPGQSAVWLKAGHGLRVYFAKRQSATYQAPRKVEDRTKRMELLFQESPAMLLRYVQDLAQSPARPLAERRKLIDVATGIFYRARKYQEESVLWSLAVKLDLYAPQTTFAMYMGCKSCLLRKSFARSCQTMCGRFLKEGKDPHTRKHALYLVAARWLSSQATDAKQRVTGLCEDYKRDGHASPSDAKMDALCKQVLSSPSPRK